MELIAVLVSLIILMITIIKSTVLIMDRMTENRDDIMNDVKTSIRMKLNAHHEALKFLIDKNKNSGKAPDLEEL